MQVKIVSINKIDGYYDLRKRYIGRTGTMESYGPCPRVKGFLRGVISFRSKKLGSCYFYAVKVGKITRKRRTNGN